VDRDLVAVGQSRGDVVDRKVRIVDRADVPKLLPNRSLALRMFPKVFPLGMKMAPGELSGGHFRW